MNLYVYSQATLASKAQALVHRLGVEADSQISHFPIVPRTLPARAHCVLLLSGNEPTDLIRTNLRRLARGSRWSGKVVLYSESPELDKVVVWARLLERLFPKRSHVCFVDDKLARVLKLHPVRSAQTPQTIPAVQSADVSTLRRDLGLTQEQMASAVGVSPRTVQNWELGKPSPRTARRLQDLFELREVLKEYLPFDQLGQWLSSANDSFEGSSPVNWILAGRARDVLLGFRRLQTGEPW